MKPLSILFIITFLVAFTSLTVSAQTVNTKTLLQISPINCLIDTVNNGTNVITYISPEACNRVVLPNPIATQTQQPTRSYSLDNPSSNSLIATDPAVVVLDYIPKYLGETGVQLPLEIGQKILFYTQIVNTSELHSIKLEEVGRNYVVITIASTPQNIKLYVGDQRMIDADNNGIFDVEITLLNIVNGKASLTFRKLVNIYPETLGEIDNNATNNTHTIWLYVAFALVDVFLLILFIQKRFKFKLLR